MKRLIAVLLILCGASGPVMAAQTIQPESDRYFVWALAAVEQVVSDMYECLAPVDLSDFQGVVSYLIKQEGVATKAQILKTCMADNISLQSDSMIFDAEMRERVVNNSIYTNPEKVKECKDRKYLLEDVTSYKLVNSSGVEQYSRRCDIFLSNLIKQNNKYAKYCNPGTYVKEYKLDSGRMAYKVVDVVLAEGYLSDYGTINDSVNQADDNIGIYLDNGTDEPCSAQRIGSTWTNDSFMRITEGNIRGANTDAYIFLDMDMTARVEELLADAEWWWDIITVIKSRQGGAYDIKNLDEFRRKIFNKDTGRVQAEGRVPDNGVVYMGKVCNLDALGHIVFAINNRRIAKTGMDVDTQDVGEWVAEQIGKETEFTKQFWRIGYRLYDQRVEAAAAYKRQQDAIMNEAAQAGVSIGNPFVNFHMP